MNQQPLFAAVILAAGASRRMGFPKAMLQYQGERFVNRLVRVFRCACHEVVVVRSALSGEWQVAGAHVVENPDPERGMLSSLQCGLRAVSTDADAVFFTPVDYPAISQNVVVKMADAWNRESALILPRTNGRRGHPALVSRRIVPELLSLRDGAQARDIVHRHESEIQYVDVDEPGILHDIDDAEQYSALRTEPEQ